MGFFSDHKSIPTRGWAFWPSGYTLYSRSCTSTYKFWLTGGMVCSVVWSRVCLETRELNPRSSIYDQKEIPLHYFYHWFQKPGICAGSYDDERRPESRRSSSSRHLPLGVKVPYHLWTFRWLSVGWTICRLRFTRSSIFRVDPPSLDTDTPVNLLGLTRFHGESSVGDTWSVIHKD
jgi:hypothetical protein